MHPAYLSGATQKYWNDLDSLFATAQKNGVYIMATFMSFDHFHSRYTTYERWRNWINNDAHIDFYITSYVIPFVQRYGNNTALWSIDLMNEVDWSTDTETSSGNASIPWQRFQQYFAKAAKAIHNNSEVLVTVGIGVIKYNSDEPGMDGNMVSDTALRAQLDDLEARLDFWSPHWYA